MPYHWLASDLTRAVSFLTASKKSPVEYFVSTGLLNSAFLFLKRVD